MPVQPRLQIALKHTSEISLTDSLQIFSASAAVSDDKSDDAYVATGAPAGFKNMDAQPVGSGPKWLSQLLQKVESGKLWSWGEAEKFGKLKIQ